MLRQALAPDTVSYRALISASEKGQELRRAIDVCAEMLRQALEPDMVSYNAVISAYEKAEELRRTFDVCEAMLRQALKPNMSQATLGSAPAGRAKRCVGHSTSARN